MVGKPLSHYEIVGEIGRGGMGIVYRAEDTRLGRTVAIKVLPPAALTSEDDRARFYREARAAAQLQHSHIASVYEIDEAPLDGSAVGEMGPFIVMEFIEGQTLQELIRRGPLDLDEAVRIAAEMASALETAHESDIVHRDIKSGNVMLTVKGQAKILDFGLAKTAQSTKLTQMGSTVGTVAYMSPEQARGEDVDRRTDIWSLGVVLYEMVAGRHPFPGEYEQAVVYQILNEDPEPLSAIRASVPMELERIVRKCMAKRASARYQSATELLVDLENIGSMTARLSGASGAIHATAGGGRGIGGRRSRLRLAAIATLSMVVGALAYRMTVPVAPGTDSVLRKLPLHLDGITAVYFPVMNPEETHLYFHGVDTADVLGLYGLDLQNSRIELVEEGAVLPHVSPDGSRLAYWVPGQGAFVKTLPNGRPRHVSDVLKRPHWIDDRTVVSHTLSQLGCIAVDIFSREERTLFEMDAGDSSGVQLYVTDVDPTSRLVFYSYEYFDGTPPVLYVFDMKTGVSRMLLEGATSPRSGGGRTVIYQPEEGLAWRYQSFSPEDLAFDGEPVEFLPPMQGGRLQTTPAGDPLVVGTPYIVRHSVRVYSVDGRPLQTVDLPDDFFPWSLNRNGTSVAGIRPVSNLFDWEVLTIELSSGVERVVDDSPGDKGWTTWSPDDSRIIFDDWSGPEVKMMTTTADGLGEAKELATGYRGVYSQSGSLLAFFRKVDDRHYLIVRDESTLEERTVADLGIFEGASINGFSADESFVMYRIGLERSIVSLGDAAAFPVPLDLYTWGPEGRFLYGQRGQRLIRAPYSTDNGFEFTGGIEVLFEIGPQKLQELLVLADRTVKVGPHDLPDHTVITWWKNWAKSVTDQ